MFNFNFLNEFTMLRLTICLMQYICVCVCASTDDVYRQCDAKE